MTMQKTVGAFNLIAYGVGDIFGGGSYLVIGTLFLFFLTEVVGLSPIQAGLVVSAGKLWDAVSDPLMGYISDRTKTRFGRRRVYFLIGVVPVFLGFMLLWMPSAFAGDMQFVWHLFTYILFCTTLTLVMVPYIALIAEITDDYRVRNKLAGSRIIFSGISILICGVVPMLIINSMEVKQGYLAMGIIFGLFFALPWILTFVGTWELPQKATADIKGFKEFYLNFLSVFRNKSFRIQTTMYILAYSAMDILMALFVFFLTYYVLKADQFSLLMGSLMLAYITAIPIYVKISNIIGQGRAYIIGMFVGATAMALVYFTFIPTAPIYVLVLVSALMGLGLSGGAVVVHAMLPAIIDVDELITTGKRGGTYAGMLTLIRKIIQSLVLFVISLSLSLIGYTAGQVPTPQTAEGLRLLFVLGPMLISVIGIIIGLKYRITPEVHQCLLGEIERLASGGTKAAVNPNTARVCEELSGLDYANLYNPENTKSIKGSFVGK